MMFEPFDIFAVQLLDNLAGQKPQLTALELFMLSTSVAAAASGPWILGGKLTEFLAPTAAACTFHIGLCFCSQCLQKSLTHFAIRLVIDL